MAGPAHQPGLYCAMVITVGRRLPDTLREVLVIQRHPKSIGKPPLFLQARRRYLHGVSFGLIG